MYFWFFIGQCCAGENKNFVRTVLAHPKRLYWGHVHFYDSQKNKFTIFKILAHHLQYFIILDEQDGLSSFLFSRQILGSGG